MIQTWESHGITYCHGTAKVISAPKVYRARKVVCNFSGEIENYPNGDTRKDGSPDYKNELISFNAFGKLAEYCALLEKGDIIQYYGKYVVDEYWTERNNTGEVQYKIILEYASAQGTGELRTGNAPDDGWGYEPPY